MRSSKGESTNNNNNTTGGSGRPSWRREHSFLKGFDKELIADRDGSRRRGSFERSRDESDRRDNDISSSSRKETDYTPKWTPKLEIDRVERKGFVDGFDRVEASRGTLSREASQAHSPPRKLHSVDRDGREVYKGLRSERGHAGNGSDRVRGSENRNRRSDWEDIDEDGLQNFGGGFDRRPEKSSEERFSRSRVNNFGKETEELSSGEMGATEKASSSSRSSEMEEGELQPEEDVPKETEAAGVDQEGHGNLTGQDVERNGTVGLRKVAGDGTNDGESKEIAEKQEEGAFSLPAHETGGGFKEGPEMGIDLKEEEGMGPGNCQEVKKMEMADGELGDMKGMGMGHGGKHGSPPVAQEPNNQKTEQSEAGLGVADDDRKEMGDVPDARMGEPEEEVPKESREIVNHGCQELTLSYMCDRPKPPVGMASVKAEAKGNFLWSPLEKPVPQEGGGGKDKGKQVALSLSNDTDPADFGGRWVERDFLQLGRNQEEEQRSLRMERGTSSRGVNREEEAEDEEGGEMDLCGGKQKQKKLKIEPFQLSLGLPDVSLTLASPMPNVLPAAPSGARSVQSLGHTNQTKTSSDGFTTSLSVSHSHPFVHNSSCSLTQNSMENYEYSVGSRPVSQGNDQVSHGNRQVPYASEQVSHGNNGLIGLSQDRFKPCREVPLYQRILQNGSLQAHQASQGMFVGNSRERNFSGCERGASNTHSRGSYPMAQGQQVRSLDGSLARSNGYERQISLPRELPERSRQEVWSSPPQSVSSRETRSEQRKQIEKDTAKSEGDRAVLFHRGKHGRDGEQVMSRSLISAERIVFDIVSEPIPIMAQKLPEMPDSSLGDVREYLKELIGNNERREELANFQKVLKRRSDLTSEALSKSHRIQLEILVTLKTGIRAFLQHGSNLPTIELVEIFLHLRCKNLACKSLLPVDDCDCKICSPNNGFCSACMCLICSKFDFASNTCSWVGCDLCLHWCHTDCGINMSYIKPGPSITGPRGTTEMQFHCIACDHSSEMFGFVKEVFKTCAKDWGSETLAKELDCVRRIFQGSEDPRGKQLRSKIDEMLAKLESKVGSSSEVCDSILLFLTDSDSKFCRTNSFVSEDSVQLNQRADACDQVAVAVFDAVYKMEPGSNEKVGEAPTIPQINDREHVGKKMEAAELQYDRARKKAEIDELESIVRIKQAEAKMFQTRADDARREAEGLKRIALAKNDKIEEEYSGKLAKLCLNETEERRRQKLEELQIIEGANHNYYNMKMRMEKDIKDLLRKMEAARGQFL